jgi:hypothetical protein
LEIYIHHFTVLINSAPKIMLFAVYLMVRHTGEDFIDEEYVTVSSVFPLQSSSV